LRLAEKLATDGIAASVLDLRSLVPLDRDALLHVARHCHKVLVIHEDSRTGGIGESLAAIIQEEAFESLDAPIRIVGALDTPVPKNFCSACIAHGVEHIWNARLLCEGCAE